MEWPVLLADWLLPGSYGAAILGLLLSWRWQALGGLLALAALAGRFVFWRLVRGKRVIHPFGLSLFGLPALLYLLTWAAAPRASHWARIEGKS